MLGLGLGGGGGGLTVMQRAGKVLPGCRPFWLQWRLNRVRAGFTRAAEKSPNALHGLILHSLVTWKLNRWTELNSTEDGPVSNLLSELANPYYVSDPLPQSFVGPS